MNGVDIVCFLESVNMKVVVYIRDEPSTMLNENRSSKLWNGEEEDYTNKDDYE